MTKWGIAGTGMIARAFAASIKDSKNSKLKYVASRSEENSSRFAKKYGCEAVKGYQNLLNLDDCDAIYIATPHPINLNPESLTILSKTLFNSARRDGFL